MPAIFAIVALSGFFCAPLISATVDELNGRVPESVRGEAMGWHAGFLAAGGVGLAVAAIVVLATTRVRRRRAARRATR